MNTALLLWAPYGYVEYLMSVRLRPKLLSDPKRFERLPVRNRHCDETERFLRLSAVNSRLINAGY